MLWYVYVCLLHDRWVYVLCCVACMSLFLYMYIEVATPSWETIMFYLMTKMCVLIEKLCDKRI